MLHILFQKKNSRVIAVILGVAVLITVVLIFANDLRNKNYQEQTVMAENYLDAGNYEQAIDAYQRALSMKSKDQEILTIGIAQAYERQNEYDKALEALRACYAKTSGFQLKKKIEEITAKKTAYLYAQAINRAEVYYKNEEYQKAICEYEEAKKIKSKDVAAYQGIVDAYIQLEKYDLAKEEVLEGQEITQDKSLNQKLEEVISYLKKEEYVNLLSQAEEYIYQENYVDAIAKYLEAINLIPKEVQAYAKLAQTYMAQENYDGAILFLQNAIAATGSGVLEDLLSQATDYQVLENEKDRLLYKLFYALKNRNIKEVTDLMKMGLFRNGIVRTEPVYYSAAKTESSESPTLIVYDANSIYYGSISNDVKNGSGIYFRRTKGSLEKGYYYYDGNWHEDVPNGSGKTVEADILADDNGVKYISETLTEGSFVNSLEDGRMTKYFYEKGTETGKLTYSAKNGIPLQLGSGNSQEAPTPGAGSYIIGVLISTKDGSGEYYSVEPQTTWGVKPFIHKSE